MTAAFRRKAPVLLGCEPRGSKNLVQSFRRAAGIKVANGFRRGSVVLLLGCILGGALGLNLFSVKGPVAGEAAVSQGLRIIFEGIGERLGAAIDDIQNLVVFDQHKIHMRPAAADRPRLDITGHAQAL